MEANTRVVRFDDVLQVEAYQFTGVAQKFPNHFHEYYVIGLIEAGERHLAVNHRDCRIGPGDMLAFNPMDNHACEQADAGGLSYRCLNIQKDVMAGAVRELGGTGGLPRFRAPVLFRTPLGTPFAALHQSIMEDAPSIEREELFLLFLQQLLAANAGPEDATARGPAREELEEVCAYLERHCAEHITLDELSGMAGLNKYTFIRMFTRLKGITPYRYLETLRIGRAKKLLEAGVEPAEAAQQTGFSDQSHFTNYFNKFIGLTPGQYQAIFREVSK